MKNLVLPIIVALSLSLGIGAGYIAKTKLTPPPSRGDQEPPNHESSEISKTKNKKSKHGDSPGKINSIYKFPRQFVIPVLKDGQPLYMVILDLNIELGTDELDNALSSESRLRDTVIGELFELASKGLLGALPESTEARAAVKAALVEEIRPLLGEDVEDVLIQGVGIQNY